MAWLEIFSALTRPHRTLMSPPAPSQPRVLCPHCASTYTSPALPPATYVQLALQSSPALVKSRLGSPSSPPLLTESSVTSVSSLAQKVQQAGSPLTVTTPNHRRGSEIRGEEATKTASSYRAWFTAQSMCRRMRPAFSLPTISFLLCLSAAASFSFIFAVPRVAGLRKFYPDLCCQDHHPLILHTHPVARSSRHPKCLTRPKVS